MVAIPRTTYAVKQVLPNNPSVVIVFRGLFTFCFSGNQNCEVGINNQAADPDQFHKLNVNVWRKGLQGCIPVPIVMPNPITRIDLEVQNATELDGVYVFQRNPQTPFDRMDLGNHPKDFRWALDFEGPDLYNERLLKQTNALRPSLQINNGIFYTRQTSRSKFKLHSKSGDKQIGSVAKLIAANVYLGGVSFLDLKINGILIKRLEQEQNITHQIDFKNDCEPPAGHCGYHPGNSAKETRNDFYLHHRTFNRPGGKDELELICTDVQTPVKDPELCGTISDEGAETTDPAPCMGGVFGQSPSLD